MRRQHWSAAMWMLVCLSATTAVAQNPFSGVWKMNDGKSRLAGDKITFRSANENGMELTAGGLSYSFRADGKTYRLPDGHAVIWAQPAADSWTTETRTLHNKLLRIDRWQLSPDGKQLTKTTSSTRADGQLFNRTEDYQRIGEGSGLVGSWQGTQVKRTSPSELTIQENGLDKLTFKLSSLQGTSDLTLDGKEAPVDGPDLPTAMRLSLMRTGPYTLKLVRSLNGTTVFTSVYTLHADDTNLMTEEANAPGDPAQTRIWEKQGPAPRVMPLPTVGAPLRP